MIDYEELGKRAVQCKDWRWMPGMRYAAPSGYYYRVDDVAHAAGVEISDECVPDLSDRATLGCLLHLVREHWGDGGAHTRRLLPYGGGEKWLCVSPSIVYPAIQTHGDSEAEALVKALEIEVGDD